ncbi:hypothetical protein WMY93_015647 [Mugilogobius chulae]|uniref:Uncharacterized protein n=1 Tax=Mugilogobius chulae TaxID=88201 RepID=A0AAW0P213_9GOBI
MELRSEYSAWQPMSSISSSDVILYPITCSSHLLLTPFSQSPADLISSSLPSANHLQLSSPPHSLQPITCSSHLLLTPFSQSPADLISSSLPSAYRSIRAKFKRAAEFLSLWPHHISQPSTSPAPPQSHLHLLTTTSV